MLAADIISFIPQRAPIIMVGSLLSNDDLSTKTSFKIEAENIFLENDFFSASGIIENIAQTAAARAGYISSLNKLPTPIGYIGAIKNLTIYSLPKLNEEIYTIVTVINQIFDVTLIKGEVYHEDDRLSTECEMKIFIPK